MGWDYSSDWRSKEDVARELHLVPGDFWTAKDGCRVSCLAAHWAREQGQAVLWAVVEFIPGGCPDPDHRGFIACVLVERARGMWGYKFMDETVGPCYYSVPRQYLAMVPPPAGRYAAAWRGKVLAEPTR